MTLNYRTPVLLGGIYKLTAAPQGKDGSASDVMPAAKKRAHTQDLKRTIHKYQVPIRWHPKHPIKSLSALRLLHALPVEQRGR
jgi:2-hydroxychromene-2-carboxylate isomerase